MSKFSPLAPVVVWEFDSVKSYIKVLVHLAEEVGSVHVLLRLIAYFGLEFHVSLNSRNIILAKDGVY